MQNKAVFFDRDGVINVDYGYVHKICDFKFYDDFMPCARHFKALDYKLIVITNQSGIERGYFSVLDFLALSKYMQDSIFTHAGFYLDRIYFCPLLNDSVRRKPACGMILEAKEQFSLNLSECLLVGDNLSDIQAGINAGINKLFIINRNKDSIESNLKYRKISSLSEIYG